MHVSIFLLKLIFTIYHHITCKKHLNSICIYLTKQKEPHARTYSTNLHFAIIVHFRRQHVGAWVGNQPNNGVPKSPPIETTSPERLRGTTQDLFELLERVQCSRLDDQRCVLPAYFAQVSRSVLFR